MLKFIAFLVYRYWFYYVLSICIIYELLLIQKFRYVVYSLDKLKNVKRSVCVLIRLIYLRSHSPIVKTIVVVTTLQSFKFKLEFTAFIIYRYCSFYILCICKDYKLLIINTFCYMVYSLDKFNNVKGSVFGPLMANYIMHTEAIHFCTTDSQFIQTIPFIQYKHNYLHNLFTFYQTGLLIREDRLHECYLFGYFINLYYIFCKFVIGHFLRDEIKGIILVRVCACVCVCVYLYMCICIYLCVCMCVHMVNDLDTSMFNVTSTYVTSLGYVLNTWEILDRLLKKKLNGQHRRYNRRH